jgi:hypothetical protein
MNPGPSEFSFVVKRTGDGSLVEFRSVVDAVRCAIEVQNGMVEPPGQQADPSSTLPELRGTEVSQPNGVKGQSATCGSVRPMSVLTFLPIADIGCCAFKSTRLRPPMAATVSGL